MGPTSLKIRDKSDSVMSYGRLPTARDPSLIRGQGIGFTDLDLFGMKASITHQRQWQAAYSRVSLDIPSREASLRFPNFPLPLRVWGVAWS